MEAKQVKIEEPLRLEGLTVIPVSQTTLHSSAGNWGLYLSASKKVVAVILLSSSQKKLYMVGEEGMSMEQLLQQLPRLQDVLGS